MSWITNENGQQVWDGPPGSEPGANETGHDPTRAPTWIGGSRGSDGWIAPTFAQTYGNYTGMFPGLGQQVGQALYGSIQGRAYQPPWMQTMLPPRQNAQFDMSKYSPFQTGTKAPVNPYPLNGRVNITSPNVGIVQNWSNPFIGAYSGLTGYPGNGPGPGPGNGTSPTLIGQGGTGGIPIPTPTPTPTPVPNPSPVPTSPNTTPLPYPTVPTTQPGGPIVGGGGTYGIPVTPTPTPTNPYQPGIVPSMEPAPSGAPTPDPYGAPSLGGSQFNLSGLLSNPTVKSFLSNPQAMQGLLGFLGGSK